MLNQFRAWLDDKANNGLNFFYANDKSTGKPSVTLFMAYVSFIIACCSLVALHFKETLLTATSMSFVFVGMMVIFYMIREINKASFNLKDRSINLENTEDEDDKNA